MNTPDHLVSVVMCTYNGEQFLEEQLQSIIQQSYTNLEIIISDDASSDSTPEIIKQFAQQDKRIRFLSSERNKGVNKNFEQAFLTANGYLIAIADQDDVWKFDKIEKLVSLFAPGIILVHGASVNFTGSDIPFNKKYQHSFIPFTGNDARKLLLRNSISGHSVVFKKDLLKYCLPVPETLYYDWWINEVATCTGNIAATNEVLTFHRIHEKNFAAVYKKNTKKQTIAEYNERRKALDAFLLIPGMPRYARAFAKELFDKMKNLEQGKFSIALFLFLLKNSSTLFFYKKKTIPYFSYIKTSYRMSFAI